MRSFGSVEEDKSNRVSDLRLWQRLIDQCRGHEAGLAGSALLSLLVTAAALVQPRLLQVAIDTCMTGPNVAARLPTLARIALLYSGIAFFAFGAGFVQVVVLERIGQAVMHRLRSRLHRHLLSLDLAFFQSHPAGRLVTRLTSDIQNLNEMFTSILVTLSNDALKFFGILILLYYTNVRLAALMTLFLPLSLGATLLFSRLAREGFRAIRSQLAVLNSFLQETISAVGTIQLFGQEAAAADRLSELNQEYLRRNIGLIRIFSVFMPLTELLSSVAAALILWYGGGEVMRKHLTLGELTAFLAYMRLFFQPMQELARKYSIVQSALASAERIFELFDLEGAIKPPAQPLDGSLIIGDIRFEQVCFTYPSNEEQGNGREAVLQDIDLHIHAGETVAVVGPTGAGKSTLVSLLVRFHDPTAGRILIDGHDLREFAPRTLREKIGLVLQDVLLEPDTVLANICQDTNRSRMEVQELLIRTGMDAFVDRLPRRLDTRIGEGIDLSAGERQLIAFARVLCRDPAVLILDEATSSVDNEAEQLLAQAVRTGFAGRTVVVIAHRLSTVRQADRIIVLDQGRIAEQGTHVELMRRHGLYLQLAAADSLRR